MEEVPSMTRQAGDAPGERSVRLRNGAQVWLRPIRPDDEDRLMALYGRLSPESARQRFFTGMKWLPRAWARYFANVDYRDRLAVVAEREEAGQLRLIGVARYDASKTPGSAEIAIVIEDAWQGRGLGAILLHEILDAGARRGIATFRADVLADNRRMLGLLARHSEIVRQTTEQGVTELVLRARPQMAEQTA
jgi:RimJ/RimL family protein N-acetyltransferase